MSLHLSPPSKSQPQIDDLLKQLKPSLQQLMTTQQKRHLQKLSLIYKDLAKTQKVPHLLKKELGIEPHQQSLFFSSIKIQLTSLKKDILNNKKSSMSDYEAFLFKYELYKAKKDVFLFVEQKPIMERITLAKRAVSTEQKSLIGEMREFSFCPLGRSIGSIIQCSMEILYENSYCQKLFKRDTMDRLLNQVAKEYQIVSYHNFTHAFSVQLMLFQCYEKSQKLKNLFTPFEIFVSYISALAHDLGHYGTNSDFQIKKKSQLAKLYSNQSVLENMHVAKFCKMLRKYPQIDIISQIKDPVERQRTKRLLIRLILGTDVSKHFDNLSRLKALQPKQLPTLDLLQRQTIQQNIFHACDIGNCCLQFTDFMNWALLLSYEFNSQYEMELIAGLQPTPIFRYTGLKGFYKGQCGFVEVLAMPLWRSIAEVFGELGVLVGQVEGNWKRLEGLVESVGEGEGEELK